VDPNAETVGGSAPVAPNGLLLAPQQIFGPYRIHRPLGKGGMGEVYEAEDLATGRRVALKVLTRALADRDASERFLREGRSAAAVSHPNSVYVFGSHEVNGVPAIAMELVAGGTLQDAVDRDGPMPVAGAVDAVLQLIEGLEAAEARGVLHRDIKPSNCFVDAEGVVKIGDYGLSLPTSGDETRLTVAGTFLGTPAYASPEQVHGRQFDVRSDIYSVSATLYFLLTSSPPFKRDGVMQMLAAVLQDTPETPRKLSPAVPEALAQVVLRGLKKDPAARFASYADLREALLPFAERPLVPASIRSRVLASVIDLAILATLVSPVSSQQGIVLFVVATLYFGVLEGYWGASIGKHVLGVRVVGGGGGVPGVGPALVRASIWGIATSGSSLMTLLSIPVTGFVSFLVDVAGSAVLFSRARAATGYRGFHELASGTRTVIRPAVRRRLAPVHAASDHRRTGRPSGTHIAGYSLDHRLWAAGDEALDLATDDALQRRVWIHHVDRSQTQPSAVRQAIGRKGRLRWLASRRSDDGNWDAYQAVDGKPLEVASWSVVRHWLLDLAVELDHAVQDGTVPRMVTIDHVWIADDGTAMLLEFPAEPSREPSIRHTVADITSAQAFLHDVAVNALSDDARKSLPVSGLMLMTALSQRRHGSCAELITALQSAAQSATSISRRHRAMALAVVALPLMLGIAATMTGSRRTVRDDPALDRADAMLRALRSRQPADQPVSNASQSPAFRLGFRLAAWLAPRSVAVDASPAEWRAFALFVAAEFGGLPEDERAWSLFRSASETRAEAYRQILADARKLAEAASPEERSRAEQDAAGIIAEVTERMSNRLPFWLAQVAGRLVATCWLLVLIGLISIVVTGVLRAPPALRVLGYEVVSANGRASRPRAVWRGLVAWSPVLIGASALSMVPTDSIASIVIAVPAVTAMLAGALLTLWRPHRAVHERLSGTWVVPS
jgi:hypothetical protein